MCTKQSQVNPRGSCMISDFNDFNQNSNTFQSYVPFDEHLNHIYYMDMPMENICHVLALITVIGMYKCHVDIPIPHYNKNIF